MYTLKNKIFFNKKVKIKIKNFSHYLIQIINLFDIYKHPLYYNSKNFN